MIYGKTYNDFKEINRLSELAFSFWKSRVLFTGVELGVFSTLGDDEMTAEELSEKTNVPERSLTRLLNAMTGIELLHKERNRFRNAEGTKKYLIKSSPDFAGQIMYVANQWDLWSRLTESIKLDAPVVYEDFLDKDEDWMSDAADTAHWKAKLESDILLDNVDFDNVKNVLDLGGGTGLFLHRMLDKYPHLNVTLYENPRMTKYAVQYLESVGMRDKVRVISGSLFENEFGSEREYDLTFISHILSQFSIWDCVQLLKKVYHFTQLNGRVVINEMILDDSRTSPPEGALRSLDLLVNTKKGGLFTETDIWVMLRESMFLDITRLDVPPSNTLMIGCK